MTYSLLLVLAAFAVPDAALASVGTAKFGCDARAGQTCFFKIFLGPRSTRIVQLQAGTTTTIPGVDIGRDTYCVDLKKPPLNKCIQKSINPTYNN
jgi:hypothetical protein